VWCFGRFDVADGRYLEAVAWDPTRDPVEPPVILPDGRELFVQAEPRAAGAPARWRVVVVSDHGRAMAPLRPELVGLRAARLGARAEVALVERANGSLAVVALPGGRTVLELPRGSRYQRVAMNAQGDRLALAATNVVTVYALGQGAPRVLGEFRARNRRIVFGHGGRTLVVDRGDDTLLSVWREGPPAPPVTARVAFRVPQGFEPGAGAPPWLPVGSRHRNAGLQPRAEHGLVAQYRGAHVSVGYYVTDGGELAAFRGRTTGWTRAVMERFAVGGYDPSSVRAWRSREGERQVEWRTPAPDGASWTRVRVVERGGALHRVELTAREPCPRTAREDCTAIEANVQEAVRAFLLEPFGVARSR
jgi:hypothetical protein